MKNLKAENRLLFSTSKNKFLPFCFFASSNFGCWVLKTIIKKYKPALVITLAAQPAGRGLKLAPNIIFSLALKEKLPVVEIGDWTKINDLNFEFGLIAGFGKIIPGKIFTHFKNGILNLHPSLLPKYRGVNPIREPILNGDDKTGATLFLIDEGIDTGPILAQTEICLTGDETIIDLEMKLGQLAGNLFNETIKEYLNNEIKPIPQDNSKATYTKKLSRIDGWLKIEEDYKIWDRKIRAFQGFPTTFIKVKIRGEEKILKIFAIEKLEEKQLPAELRKIKIGQFFVWRNELGLKISDAFIAIKELHLQDKKRMSSKEFLNGYPLNSIKLSPQ
jgi:methionyl-tRNA formyltransferase